MNRSLLAALALVVCLAPARAQSPEQKKATIDYVRGLQAADGGFLPARADAAKEPAKSSLRATSAAIRALKYFGGELKDREACVHFVEGCFDRRAGGFGDQPGAKPDVVVTAVGAMAVVELKLPTDVYSPGVVKYLGEHAKDFEQVRLAAAGLEALQETAPQAKAWQQQILQTANADGTFGKGDGAARDTGSAAAALLRLGHKFERTDRILEVLKAGQRADGGFGKAGAEGSDLETSYRVVRSFVMLQAKPNDVARLRAFIARCRNDDGGYAVTPGQPSSVSGTYFAGILLHWLER